MKPHHYVSISVILGLVVLQLAAMHYGINGTMRTIIFSMLAGIAGLSIPEDKFYKFLELIKGGAKNG